MQDEWGIDKNGETIYCDEYGTRYVRDENGNRRQMTLDISDFSIHQPVEPLYSLGGWTLPDKDWSYIDKEGHTHKFHGEELPSLEFVGEEREEYWCDSCDDIHDRVTVDGWYICKQCGDKVVPKYRKDYGPVMINGRTEYRIYGLPVTEKQFEAQLQDVTGSVAREELPK